ncbi:MAG TPA: hypothetical protein VHF22_14965 [Planctomycetota bacterium]|nr:hypothetical protein [Planctomycetota bacterium]
MRVDWKRFSEDLAEWEQATSHDRFMDLCMAIERAIRRAFRKDGLLDFVEVTAALDRVAEEMVRMRRENEGRKPCERICLEVEAPLAERLKSAARGAGLDVGELVTALLDRQLLSAAEPEEPAPRRRERRRRRKGAEIE